MKVKVGVPDGDNERGVPVTAMKESGPRLRDQLDRWTAAGIIDAGQAERIESAEQARTATRDAGDRPHRALPLVAEVLGYFGAVIAISAGYLVIRRLWPGVPPAASLSFTGVVAVLLAAVGAVLRTDGQPAYARLRSVLWLLATAAGTGFAAILADAAFHLGPSGRLLTAAAAWAGLAIAFWWRGKSVLQHVVLFGGLVALLCAVLNLLNLGLSATGYGTAIWILSALWGVAAYRGYLAPPTAGLASACTGALAGVTATVASPAGQALALLTVAGLLAIGVATSRVLFIGFGAVGTLWVVPETANRYLPGSLTAPLTAAVVGLVLLAIALWLARTRRKTG